MSLHILSTQEELSEAVAEYVQQLSATAIQARDKFVVALSGGSLPKILSAHLVTEPRRSQIDWSNWHVFWADERRVPLDHQESNYRLAKEVLFDHVSIPQEQIYPIDDTLKSAAVAARAYETKLREVLPPDDNKLPRFDLILLGMGEDGHTASLFPGHALLKETNRWVASIIDSPKPPPQRITLTYPVVNNANYVAFLTTGVGKAEMLPQAIETTGPESRIPAGRVQPTHGQVDWFIDKAAATHLID